MGVQRVEPGAEEGAGIQPRQPAARGRKARRGTTDQKHGKRRHGTQVSKPETSQAGPHRDVTGHQHAADVCRDLDLLDSR